MNFFFYRLPDSQEIIGQKSGRYIDGPYKWGFNIVPFDRSRDVALTIPADCNAEISELPALVKDALAERKAPPFRFPKESTSESQHRETVEAAIQEISSGRLDKCVISRVILKEGKVDVAATFENLLSHYPKAFVFCFYTSSTGLWLGASPELLLKKEGTHLSTMALAGTMPSESDEKWDEKNIREHRIVTEFIAHKIREFGMKPDIGDMTTVEAGPVRHLRTAIECELREDNLTEAKSLAEAMSPTPALSGYPVWAAKRFISNTERHERSYYGGFIGLSSMFGDIDYYVNLRSMWIDKDRFALFCGGGIMIDSNPEKEWEETERKSRTLLDMIEIENQ